MVQPESQNELVAEVDVSARIDAFVEAFNRNDLDAVMGFFADDAVYRPGDGTEHRGRPAIRSTFEPQFAGAYGKMYFEEYDRLVDVAARKIAIRWSCHHDMTGPKGARVPALQRFLYRMLMGGTTAGWHGLDVFHLDEAGKIAGKFSYGESKRPLLRQELGRTL